MVANSGFVQIWLFSTLPNPQTTGLEYYDVHWKSFYLIPHLPYFCSCGLVVDDTVHGEDNFEEKTREEADIRIYHISWHFLIGCDMLWWCWLIWEFFMFSTCLTALSTWELVLDNTVHGEDNLEEKTRQDADNRMYYLGLNLFNKDVICYCDGGWPEIFLCFQLNMTDYKYMWVSGHRHCGPGG